ncbi:peroxiredoxin-like family protein [Rheinheimera tilapiae]|uniref:thioredoxin-dependent peroxiredoxin n=1 Tax=Rheinheimera tilapiae TaxID=875043 RepID=A0ABV6B9Q0_9GAMM
MTRYQQMLFSIALLLSTFFAGAAEIALKPEQIRPLLNGQSVPSGLQVQDSKGATIDLSALLSQQKTILVFYRGGWCPYCNTQLAGLRDIAPQLQKLGYRILAISPELPTASSKSEQMTKDAALNYQLLSDPHLNALQGFGVAYYMDAATEKTYKGTYGIQLTYDSTGQAVLPAPAVFIISKSGEIQFSYVHINYKTRLQPRLLLLAAELANQ